MISGVFMATCKERDLRKKDPNRGADLISFYANELRQQGVTGGAEIENWYSTEAARSGHLIASPGAQKPVIHVGFGSAQFPTGTGMELASSNLVLSWLKPGQTELYMRISLNPYVSNPGPGTTGNRTLFKTKNPEGMGEGIELRLERPEPGKSVKFVVLWTDTKGVAHRFSYDKAYSNWQRFKVFFTNEGVHIQAWNTSETIMKDEVAYNSTDGFIKGTPDSKHYLLWDGVTPPTNCDINLDNWGFGSSIENAPPRPKI